MENCVFPNLGRGNWASCVEGIVEGLTWAQQPWELVSEDFLRRVSPTIGKLISGKSEKVQPGDGVQEAIVTQGSSTELSSIAASSYDLVITDPPFSGLLHYSELADFFYVWIRLMLKNKYPELFDAE